MNPESSDGTKHCIKETEELPEKEKVKVSIANGPSAKAHFEKCRSKHVWGLVLSKEPDENLDNEDVIKNCQDTTKDNALAFNDACLGNELLEKYATDRLLLDLDPAKNHALKQRLHKPVPSQMLA